VPPNRVKPARLKPGLSVREVYRNGSARIVDRVTARLASGRAALLIAQLAGLGLEVEREAQDCAEVAQGLATHGGEHIDRLRRVEIIF
jgi:hypothetical protein